MFPTAYLVHRVEERAPFNGRISNAVPDSIFRDRTVFYDTIIQKMLLITGNARKFKFQFGENPWPETGSEHNLSQLTSVVLDDEKESVSNTVVETGGTYFTLDDYYQYFSSIEIQCFVSLQDNPSNSKHICFLELKAEKSKGQSTYGARLEEGIRKIGGVECIVYKPEKVVGSLVITGIGIDHYAGFVFQIAKVTDLSNECKESSKSILMRTPFPLWLWNWITRSSICCPDRELLEDSFYEKKARLTPAGITHYNYFESYQKDQTGYKDSEHYSVLTVRNLFREIAMEDKEAALLFQTLNHLYPVVTLNPIPQVLPRMLDLLDRCFLEGQIGLIQSVIRIDHIRSDEFVIEPAVRIIWSTLTESISMVKQFVLVRPNLNIIECAILDDSLWPNKIIALLVALAQIVITVVLCYHVMWYQCCEKPSSGIQWTECVENCIWLPEKYFWKVPFSGLMSFLALFLTCIKVYKQIDDKSKFNQIFWKLISKDGSKWTWLNNVLLFLDLVNNVWLSVITVFLTFFIISLADEVSDLVLNALAITFVVELDEELNSLDPIEVSDLVKVSFKSFLKKKMEIAYLAVDNLHKEEDIKASSYVTERLTGANYSSDQYSRTGLSFKDKVEELLKKKKRFTVTNNALGGDPEFGKPKFLVMHFEGNNKKLSTFLREKAVVDLGVLKRMLEENRL